MTDFLQGFGVMSLDSAATLLGRSSVDLLAEANAGRLTLSVTLSHLLEWKAEQDADGLTVAPLATDVPAGSDEQADDATNQKLDLVLGQWEKSAPFAHTWPNGVVEHYEGFQTTAQINKRTRVILVGFTTRASAGMADRARAVVFYGALPKERPLVEFSGNGNLQTTTRYASPIKLRDSHVHLRPSDALPDEFAGMIRAVFSTVVQGPYAANSVAVVAHTDDQKAMLDTMAKHGVIRGWYKGWL